MARLIRALLLALPLAHAGRRKEWRPRHPSVQAEACTPGLSCLSNIRMASSASIPDTFTWGNVTVGGTQISYLVRRALSAAVLLMSRTPLHRFC